MISSKLIAPVAGVMVIPCVAALAAGVAQGKGTSSTKVVRTPVFGDAVLSSRLLTSDVLAGQPATLAGMLAPTLETESVALQERDRHGWHLTATRLASDPAGGFQLRFRERKLGTHVLRLALTGSDGVYYTPATRLTVFHRVLVSWYDLTGRTACGTELTAATRGVASRTLPCGTIVTFRYRHRLVRVPVIDRGPYVLGRAFDLTYATKIALGAGDLTEVWASR